MPMSDYVWRHQVPDPCLHHPTVVEEIQRFQTQAASADVTVMTVLLSIVGLLGCLGNAVVILVCFKFPSGLPSAQHFIMVIAICDFLVSLIIIPFRITSYHVTMPEVICKCLEGMTYCSILFSVIMLIAVAFDRYFAVCHPVTFQRVSPFAKTGSLCVWVVCIGISFPAGLIAGHYVRVGADASSSSSSGSGNHSYVCFTGVCNEDGQDFRFLHESSIFLYNIFLAFLYCSLVLAVIVLYSCVFASIYRRFSRRRRVTPHGNDVTGGVSTVSNQHALTAITAAPVCSKTDFRPSSSRGSRRGTRLSHSRAAKILLLVTVCFIIAWVPFFLMKLQLLPNVVTLRLSFFASNVINPVIYSFSNRQFRDNVKKLLPQSQSLSF